MIGTYILYAFIALFFCALFTLFIVVATVLTKAKLRVPRLRKYLDSHGQIIEATVQSSYLEDLSLVLPAGAVNGALHNAGRSAFRITAKWIQPSTNVTYNFKSEPVWLDPSKFIKEGDLVKVAIDPNNPKTYLMDTSFLPTIKN